MLGSVVVSVGMWCASTSHEFFKGDDHVGVMVVEVRRFVVVVVVVSSFGVAGPTPEGPAAAASVAAFSCATIEIDDAATVRSCSNLCS